MEYANEKIPDLPADEAMAAMGEQAGIIIEQLTHEEVCGNCSKEIAADPALVERIRQEAPHLLPEKIAAEADERLAADEKAAEEKQAAIDEKVAQQVFPEEVDPYFEVKESSGGGGGGGGSAAIDPAAIRNVATWAELLQAIKDYNDGENVQQINLTADIEAGANDEPLPEIVGTDDGDLILNLGTNVLKMNGTLVNESDLTITNTAGYLALSDEFSGNNETPTVVDNSGALTLKDGTIVLSETTGVSNSGTFNMDGGAIRSGTLTTTDGISAFEQAEYVSGVAISNSSNGIVNISGGIIEAGTAVNNEGTLKMTGGKINVYDGAYGLMLYNDATLSGGTINILADEEGGDSAGGIGVNAAYISENIEYELVMNGTDVNAEVGTAVFIESGEITLAAGSAIHALSPAASAVVIADGDNSSFVINRPISAVIDAIATESTIERYSNPVFSPLYAGLTVETAANGNNTYKHTLKDRYGEVFDNWSLAEAIERFNDGEEDMTITLDANINMTAENASYLPAIGDEGDTNTLTLDLKGKTLALGESIENYGNLTITDSVGGGKITGTAAILINNTGALNLEKGTITADANVVAVNNSGTVTTPVGTSVKAVTQEKVWTGTMPEGCGVSAAPENGYYYLTVPVDDGINTWAQLVAAVDEFNALDGNGETVTLTLGADIPAATETSPITMNPIFGSNKHLVIDLNGYDLTLPQTIDVDSSLTLVGAGTISSALTSATSSVSLFDVSDTGSITLDTLDDNTPGAPTISLKQSQTAISSTQSSVYMNAGQILLNDTPATGIYSNDGYVYMTGGEIVLASYANTSANIGIQAANGAEVSMSGGTIREADSIQDAVTDEDDNIAIYASDSTVTLSSNENSAAVVSVHKGNAVWLASVSSASVLTLQGNAVVEGKVETKVLVKDNQSMADYQVEANTEKTGYYILTSGVTTSNIIPVATADEIVRAFETVNSTETEYIIQMTENINMEPYEENGQTVAYSPLTVGNSTDTTLDLNGNELMLGNTLTNNGTLMITDSVGGGKITGAAWNLIDNSGTLRVQGGTLEMIEPTSYMTEGNPGRAAAIRNLPDASLELAGGAISVKGLDSGDDAFGNGEDTVYGIYDQGGSVFVNRGSITATSGDGTVLDNAGGNAVGVYFTDTGENQLNFDMDTDALFATVRASSTDTLLVNSEGYPLDYYVVVASDQPVNGYYQLVPFVASDSVILVGSEEMFAAAINGLADGDVQIMLTNDVTLSTGYEFGDGEANVGGLDINLDGYDLILTQTLYNNTGLYIYGGGSISSVDDTADELIINNGTLVWKDTEMIVKAGQTGIYTGGELTMNSGAITGPDLEGAEEYTNGILYLAGAVDRTTVGDAVTVTGNITPMKVAEV